MGKGAEGAGISPAERNELEKLKTDIVARKKELKEQGMSGGQINKDEQVAQMVTRMNELKEKECPGSTDPKKGDKKDEKKGGAVSKENAAQVETLQAEIEEYKQKLINEFKYTKRDIADDPDMKKLQGKKIIYRFVKRPRAEERSPLMSKGSCRKC